MSVRATQEGNALAGRRDSGRGEPAARSGGTSFGRGGWFRPGATDRSVGARPRVRRSFEVCSSMHHVPTEARRTRAEISLIRLWAQSLFHVFTGLTPPM